MKSQKGMATLLVTAMLLVVSLLFSLASYKNAFYQIKRTQNEVLARQAHWRAEGGLECAFSEMNASSNLPNDPAYMNTCSNNLVDTDIRFSFPSSNQIRIVSEASSGIVAKSTVTKTAKFGGGINSTIKMNASVLELTGSQHFVPNPTETFISADNFACQSVVTSGVVSYISSASGTDEHFLTTDSTVSHHGGGPGGAITFTCDSRYRSNLFDTTNIPTGFVVSDLVKGLDIIENTTVDVFQDIFGVDHAEWKTVRSEIAQDSKGDIISPSIVNGKGGDAVTAQGWITECSKLVEASFLAGNKKIWVDGSCALGANIFGGVVSDKSIMLVIHDGFVEFNASGAFNGLLYQYASIALNAKSIWEDRVDNITFPVRAFNKSDIDPNFLNVSFFVNGSTYIDGAIGIDAPDRTVRINGSIIPSYNAGKSGEFINGKLTWLEGSWYDL
ncbi:hypothetical protein [Photobacterium indicum]|uniref:Type 4 fimbrial biogenesis protein PilX N-terminal domain-containing protein n=1 Tax=Photobacterium indicum TaxID=81447 RepID=A0A2T3L5C6_9GAMM|nr:hypothetical protein [Photobacterium indicum]PSV44897.1 hypothetical protein C9J47_19650 [Photobacterium indicum]